MDFGASDEQREFRALCRRFATEVIRPVAAKHDVEESTPWEVIAAAREWGLHGMDHLQRMANDTDGQFSVIYAEELHWGCAGIALAIAQAAYEWTLSYLDHNDPQDPVAEYLDESSTAGRPPLERQAIQQRLADVATEIEAARLLVQRASWMGRNGIPMTGGQGSMSKLKAGDVTMWATTTLMDLVGPYSQSTECPLEKWFRDAKIYQLFEGTAQVQRLVISRMQARTYQERFAEAAAVLTAALRSS